MCKTLPYMYKCGCCTAEHCMAVSHRKVFLKKAPKLNLAVKS